MNKRFISFALAILLCLSITRLSNADSIPTATDPKNYPSVWTQSVYNGSGSTIVSGYIVSWDFGTSDSVVNWYDDMAMWVKTTIVVNDGWTAGVLPYGKNLLNGDVGEIIVKGPAYVLHDVTTAPAAGETCGATVTLGRVSQFTSGADKAMLGRCILAEAAASSCPDGATTAWSIIYVDVNYDDN